MLYLGPWGPYIFLEKLCRRAAGSSLTGSSNRPSPMHLSALRRRNICANGTMVRTT